MNQPPKIGVRLRIEIGVMLRIKIGVRLRINHRKIGVRLRISLHLRELVYECGHVTKNTGPTFLKLIKISASCKFPDANGVPTNTGSGESTDAFAASYFYRGTGEFQEKSGARPHTCVNITPIFGGGLRIRLSMRPLGGFLGASFGI